MHDSNSIIGINSGISHISAGIGIGIGINKIKLGWNQNRNRNKGLRPWNRNRNEGFQIPIKVLGLESEWNQWTSCWNRNRNQTSEFSWNRNRNQDVPGIVHHCTTLHISRINEKFNICI